MSQDNSREPTPIPDFHMIDDDEIVEDLLNSDVESEIHMSEECIDIKNTFLNKMHPLLDDMFKDMYNSMYTDCLDLILDEDKLSQIQANDRLTRSRCLELEDNCRMLEGNIAQLNTEIDGISNANENLSLIHQSDQNTISSLTNKVKELSILVATLEESDDEINDQLRECISSLSEANARLITQQLEVDELKRENHELK
jgi:chromosome segregation ATPase